VVLQDAMNLQLKRQMLFRLQK